MEFCNTSQKEILKIQIKAMLQIENNFMDFKIVQKGGRSVFSYEQR